VPNWFVPLHRARAMNGKMEFDTLMGEAEELKGWPQF
jgi:hypothetical protein